MPNFIRKCLILSPLLAAATFLTAADSPLATESQKISEADELMEAELYGQALDAYRSAATTSPQLEHSMPFRLRRAQALFALNQFEEAVKTLTDPHVPHETNSEGEVDLLLAKCYIQLKEYPKAIKSLEDYLAISQPDPAKLDEVHLLIGLSYFNLQELGKAKLEFQAVNKNETSIPYSFLSRLYLGKIELQEGHAKEAAEILSDLEKQIDSSNELAEEIAHYKKAANQKLNNYSEASTLFQKGSLEYHLENYDTAEKLFLQLAADYPNSPLAGDAWFWAACCSDNLNKESTLAKQRRRQAFESYPDAPLAPEAFFTYYSYQDYLQGDRAAIKHLQTLSERYPDTPFLIEANYLIGLDYKRDRKTPEGKWLRKKNLTEAIDSFQAAETLFDKMAGENKIPQEKLDYYVAVRYRATLERALANLNIANEAQGAKRHIYLEYAEEVFKNLESDFNDPHNIYIEKLLAGNPFPPLYQETLFGLSQTLIKEKNDAAAEGTLTKMQHLFEKSNTTKSYYLSRTWDELGRIALRKQNYEQALDCFHIAEESAKAHNLLSTDQRLDILIQESYCYRGLHQYDKATLLLSKVVNDPAISSLRLKAMFLRAEVYEELGRPELAKKQLESMVKKGGIWAEKAKEKLGSIKK